MHKGEATFSPIRPVNADEPYRLFDITFRAGVLGEDVSTFLTQKERTCFDTASSALSVSIEAGTTDAIAYVLLHEATHIVDSSLRLTPVARPGDKPADGDAVLAELNKLIGRDLNATLSIEYLPWSDWQQKYPLLWGASSASLAAAPGVEPVP